MKRNFKNLFKTRKGGRQKKFKNFRNLKLSGGESKKSVSSLAESVESEEISSSSSEWKIGSDELFVTCLNSDSENIINEFQITWIFLFILV